MNPIVKLAASALPGEKKYVLFAGAGVSKDAGVPTAWDLMLKTATLLYAADNLESTSEVTSEEIENWFTKSDYSNMEYADLMEILYPTYPEQQTFLKEYLNSHKIGGAHYGIAELARRGIIRAIITTNFDHYTEKALEEKGQEVQVISTDDDLKHSEPLIHCKSIRIYKPHGDLGRGKLKNTHKDLEMLSPSMEKELIQVISEHGTVVLGYSGRDKGIQEIFKKRNYNYYPLFWVDPCAPSEELDRILKQYTYIPCTGASQFIDDYLKVLERLESLAPSIGSGPTISDLRYALSSSEEPAAPIYSDYLKNILDRLKSTKPDFSKFAEYDDAIVDQIQNGRQISYDFIEAALLAARYGDLEAIEKNYSFFGDALKFYDIPDGFSGSVLTTDFDGYKFLIYEMFVSFIGSLIKNDKWHVIRDLLDEDLFVDKKYDGGYLPFTKINTYIYSLDCIRNNRLNNSCRCSVTSDFIRDRFTTTDLSKLLEHNEFMEADYFLFIRNVCEYEDLGNRIPVGLWTPKSSIFLSKPPSYIRKAESDRFLGVLARAAGFDEKSKFVDRLKNNTAIYGDLFGAGFMDGPLVFFDFDALGSRR